MDTVHVSTVLDCGHMPTPGTAGTGFGVTLGGLKKCYACCNDAARAELEHATTYTGYLTLGPGVTVRTHNGTWTLDRPNHLQNVYRDGTQVSTWIREGLASDFSLTSWPGGLLARVTSIKRTRAGFGRERWYGRACDEHGGVWSFNTPGPGMYAHMKRMVGVE